MKDLLKVLNKAVNKLGGIFSHLCIDDGTVEANNGRISIVASIPELAKIKATVPADKFIAAIRACSDDIAIKTTKSFLTIKSGTFSARIGLNTQEFPRMDYSGGEAVTVPDAFVNALNIAQSFVTSDIFDGVLLRGGGIYGMSNSGAIMVDGSTVPHDVVLPIDTVADIISIKEQPTTLHVAKEYVIVEYASFKLRSALVDKKWPDADQFMTFDREALAPITDELRKAVDTVLPFADSTKRVVFTGEALTCGEASVDGLDIPESAFNGEELANVLKHATSINVLADGTTMAQFIGPGVVGVQAGQRI
jgi:DNA polymerase III sliding clamp (beta) subunit (PCNA family)